MRRLISAVGVGLVLALAALGGRAYAQVQPDTLVWERVGTLNDVEGIFFDADTLYAALIHDPIQLLRPGDADWSRAFTSNWAASDFSIIPDRAMFLRRVASQLRRSSDGGDSWQEVHRKALTLPVSTPEDALLLGPNIAGIVAARSTDGGATWTSHGFAEGSGAEGEGLSPTNLVVIPPSDALPQGRIVASGYGGLAFSDDDGRSWQPTALYGGLAYAAWSSARITGGAHTGRLLAVVERGTPSGSPTGLYASTDGATWTRIAAIPGGETFGARLATAPDGAVYLYDRTGDEQPFYRSTDGGATWTDLGPVWTAWPAEVKEVIVGPEGRLWAACSGGGFAGFDGGVFRTVEPVFAVSAEPEEPGKPDDFALYPAYPNPSSGSVTIPLMLPEAAEVSVAVFDVLGRRVAVLADGRAEAGRHEFTLDGGSLPSGVYLVRASARGQTATRTVTVAR